MSVTPLEDAVARLSTALDGLERAIDRRRASEDIIQELEEDAHLLALDRARLARDLDQAKARSVDLETVAGEVGRRVDSAIDTIRDVLANRGG
jgi:hypothetical protein